LGGFDAVEHHAIERKHRQANGEETETLGKRDDDPEGLAFNVNGDGLLQRGLRYDVLHLGTLRQRVAVDAC